jgi:hypothetical protein
MTQLVQIVLQQEWLKTVLVLCAWIAEQLQAAVKRKSLFIL